MRHTLLPDGRNVVVGVIGLLSLVVTLTFWQVLRQDARANVARLTDLTARAVRADLAADTADRLNAMVRLAQMWSVGRPSEAEFDRIARMFMNHLRGCVAVEYVDTSYRVRWEVTADRQRHDLDRDMSADAGMAAALDAGLNHRQPAVAPQMYLPDGRMLRRISIPIYRGDVFKGFILAVFDTPKSLAGMLEDVSDLGYSIVVREDGRDLYVSPGADHRLAAEWSKQAELALPGVLWKIEVWPEANLLPVLRTSTPEIALYLGIAMCGLVILSVHSSQRARAHAHQVDMANRQLKVEMAERQLAEQALRESQARFAGVLEMSADAIVSTDEKQRITLFNRGAEAIFGYKPEEVIGRSLDLLLPSRYAASHRELVSHFSIRDEQIRHMGRSRTVIGVRKDGTEFPLEASISKLELKGERIYTAILRDVTERHTAEQALRSAHEELQQAHADLTLINSELETRVRLRTGELQRANASLQNEIGERKQAEESLRQLSGRLLQVQDEERRRLARELHDSTSQYLAALALNISAFNQGHQLDEEWKEVLADSLSLVDRCSSEIRTMSYLLHPPLLDDLGLGSALQWYVRGFSKRSGIETRLEAPPDLGRLPADLERAMFRVVQEALSNVLKHSGAKQAEIRLTRTETEVSLLIKDNGCGMPPIELHKIGHEGGTLGVGIPGMRERVRQLGGRLCIHSDGGGTVVETTLPAPPQHVSERQLAEYAQRSSV